jgi:hypothetical protein
VTKRLHAVVAGVLVVLLGTLLSTTAPLTLTAQRGSELAISRDGQHWSTTLDAPLFPRQFRFVPGDSRVETFHVLNQSDQKAELRIRVVAHDPSDWLGADKFRMRIQLDDRRWVRALDDASQPDNHMVLLPGESVPVSVRVRLRRAAPNTSMSRHLSFTLQVSLTQLTSAGRSQS